MAHVTLQRRSGAPRLIEWTGERCVPWAPDPQVVYEHLHRYLWAARLVQGRRVLDLASGEGFGAMILAESASAVVGVDIDGRSVEHARLNYGAPTLGFEVADARDLSRFPEHSFGAVVAFEMIEHVAEQERVLDEIRRVLEPDGLLVISTPDRAAYGAASPEANPFHIRELAREELTALLQTRFANTAIWGQRTITGSALAALEDPTGDDAAPWRSFFIERVGDEWRVASGLSPVYVVALASNAPLPPGPADSTLGDCGLQLVRAVEADRAEKLGEARALREARERDARELQTELEAQRSELEAQRSELEAQRGEVARLRARTASDAHTIASLDDQLNATSRQVLRIKQSVTWQLFQRVRGAVFAALGGEGSRGVDALQYTLRRLGRRMGPTAPGSGAAMTRESAPARKARIELPRSEHPEASIVIPLHAHAELTRAALESIRDNTRHVSYEVILVDDAADPATKALLQNVRGARLIVNETNIGYLRSVKRGADAARGRWLVLCNNDIEVRPGWLATLLECAESSSDVGIVTPKYLYPDGSLAEAGGIIWRDGTGVNYGRGEQPTSCRYEFRRETDYGSAAALMVRADFWREVGGFDERFLPMYYEDTDLCFQAREVGLRVVYEPRAQVVHVEGATAGVDVSVGHKRHQALNRPKFVDKWHTRLDAEHFAPGRERLWAAANRCSGARVLVVDHRVPMWDRDSGSLRMKGILEQLVALDCQVVLLPDNGKPAQPYTRELQRIGVEVLYGLDLTTELDVIGPSLDLVILSRPDTASRWVDRVRVCAPTAMVAYDTVDLHWLREARQAALGAQDDLGDSPIPRRAATMRDMELGLIRATDATLVVTDNERAQVEADVPQARVLVLPNVHERREYVPPASGREGVIFVGGFEHPPNIDGAMSLVNHVMPLVWQKLGDVSVSIVGPSAPPEVEALASSLVEVKGWVPDLGPLLDSKLALVAPLSYGAGLKGKVTQALAAGLPVVTTPIGAEGLDADDGEQLMIGDSPAELAERVVRVLRDEDLWHRLSRSGQELVAEGCSPALIAERLGELLHLEPAQAR